MNKFFAATAIAALIAAAVVTRPAPARAETSTDDAIKMCDQRASKTNDCEMRNKGDGIDICVGSKGGFASKCDGGKIIQCGPKGGTCVVSRTNDGNRDVLRALTATLAGAKTGSTNPASPGGGLLDNGPSLGGQGLPVTGAPAAPAHVR
jgi:hypothetical protein